MSQFSEHALVSVPFHEDKVFLVQHEGEPYVPLKPICTNLGLSWGSQYNKVTTGRLSSVVLFINTTGADGKRYKMASLPLRKFPAFIYSIEPSKVKPAVRGKLEAYQEECDAVLWNYWSGKEERLEQEERLRLIVREELARFKPAKAASLPVSEEEKALMYELKKEQLQTTVIAQKVGRSKSTVKRVIAGYRQQGLFEVTA